jgi:hypothetical protein
MDGWPDTIPLKKHDEWFDELKQMRADLLQMALLQPRDQDSLKEPEDVTLSRLIKDFHKHIKP